MEDLAFGIFGAHETRKKVTKKKSDSALVRTEQELEQTK